MLRRNLRAAQCQAFFDRYQDGCVLARASTHQIQLDGRSVSIPAYGIGGSNYFKLRDLGRALNFGVGYDQTQRLVVLDPESGYSE